MLSVFVADKDLLILRYFCSQKSLLFPLGHSENVRAFSKLNVSACSRNLSERDLVRKVARPRNLIRIRVISHQTKLIHTPGEKNI